MKSDTLRGHLFRGEALPEKIQDTIECEFGKEQWMAAGEMAQQLTELAALPENLGSTPSTHMVCNLGSRGPEALCLSLLGPGTHVINRYTRRQNT